MTAGWRVVFCPSLLRGSSKLRAGNISTPWHADLCNLLHLALHSALPTVRRLAGICFILGGAFPAFADVVEVRAAAHRDHGRIVFEWPEPTGFEVQVDGRQLMIRFDRPFEGDVDKIQKVLSEYVSSVAVDGGGDGKSVTFTLTAPFDVRTSHYDTSVVLDLSATGSVVRPQGPGVRVGEHNGFTRIVFDWAENVSYDVDEPDGRIEILFGRSGAPDLSRFTREPLRYIRGASAQAGGNRLKITLDVATGTGMRHFRDGNSVVVDVLRGTAQDTQVSTLAAKTLSARETRRQDDHVEKQPVSPRAQPRAAVETRPAPEIDIPADTYRLRLGVSDLPGGIQIVFPWQIPTPAAIFQRADYLWAIFSRASQADFSNLISKFSDRLITAEQLSNRHATILRFKIPADLFISVNRSELDWTVNLTATPSLPSYPLVAERELDVRGGARIFVPVIDTGGRWDLRDPEVGDLLAVVPVLSPGYGMAEERMFAEFHLLPTAQGVVIQPLSDRVDIDPRRNGVRIVGEDGLVLSAGRLPDRLASYPVALPSSNTSESALDATGQMVDYATWSRGSKNRYSKSQRDILRELAQVPVGGRNTVRWDLARFYFSHDRAAEGIGVLNVIESEDDTAVNDPGFRFLRGGMQVMLHRFDVAAEDLTDKALEANPHAALWRTLLRVAEENWPEAKRQYATGAPALKYYPPRHQARFRLAAVEAAAMTNDITMMRVELSGIKDDNLSAELRTHAAFYRGRLLEMEGDDEAAEKQYTLVAIAGYRPHAVKAEFARMKLLAANGGLDPDGQIKALESLRYKWRGGDIELEVLQTLGRKYIEAGDPASGLQTLRRAITFFPDSLRASGIAHEMNESFRNLFLEGRADNMSEVSALALYYEFRELTPVGPDGDEMIRKLSDRLVSVDLLTQAAELLEHQVKFRLRGAEKAKVGARLAIVYMLNHQAQKALTAIRISHYPRLDSDTEMERRHLEARALAEMERRAEALRVLGDDTSDEAELIRVDIHWGAKDWKKAATRLKRVLQRSIIDNEILPSQRFQVMRLAVALSLAGDQVGLNQVRARFGSLMADTPDAAPFKILTSDIARMDVEFRKLAGEIASVSNLETFMSNYREKTEGQTKDAEN